MLSTFPVTFAIVCVIMFLGDFVSTRSKGRVPSLLIIAICFLAGFWTIFPKDILVTSGMMTIRTITMNVILVQVGAMFDLKALKQEWRAVVTTLVAVLGICVVAGGIGTLIFGMDTALVAIPPLTGGGMATIIMSDTASALGLENLAMLATIVYIMQGFIGFPLTNLFLRREGITLVDKFRNNAESILKTAEGAAKTESPAKKTLSSMVPEVYKTPSYYLAKMALLALIVTIVDVNFTGKFFNVSLLMIAVGVLAGHFGVVEKDPLKKANSFGILMMGLTASFMKYFADSTPAQVFSLIIPVVVMLLLGSIGIMLFSVPIGKKLGYSTNLSIAIGLNCFLGFPHNFVITNEVIRAIAKNEQESQYLNSILMPKMIIGSIVSVSMVSALVAGLLAPFLG